MPSPTQFSVSAPASSGNLGPGFDVFGMALELRNRVRVTAGSGRVHVKGQGAGELPEDAEHNLVATAFAEAAGSTIGELRVDLHCDNRIPLARGLGSSTAAAACGILAGWTAADAPWDEDRLLEVLVRVDGHPDNAGACAHGGVVLCHDRPSIGAGDPAHLDVITLGPADWLELLAVVPDRQLPTAEARAALPDQYDRSDVVRAIGGAALLSAGLIGGHVELLADALHTDVVHEPHRADLVPELAEVREALGVTQALGATMSGAGPTVLVWCEPTSVEQAEGALGIEFPDHELLRLRIAHEGARVD